LPPLPTTDEAAVIAPLDATATPLPDASVEDERLVPYASGADPGDAAAGAPAADGRVAEPALSATGPAVTPDYPPLATSLPRRLRVLAQTTSERPGGTATVTPPVELGRDPVGGGDD
jgi:hypothetical protein